LAGLLLGNYDGVFQMIKMDTWDEMRCPECDAWFYPEKNMRKWCEKCNDKEIEGESNE
jgi:uncharacterized OB-fold protein